MDKKQKNKTPDSSDPAVAGEEKNQSVPAKAGNQRSSTEKLEKERSEYLEGWQRAKADFINYKKEEGERMGRVRELAEEGVIADMIRVLDSFDLGIASMEEGSSERKGVEMIKMQFEDVLKSYGVEKIGERIGQEFDPNREECIEQVDSKEYEAGQITEQVESGYAYKGKVIKPTRVKVAK